MKRIRFIFKRAVYVKVFLSIFAIALCSMAVLSLKNIVFAADSEKHVKEVTTVQIQENDNLWNIAERYYTTEYKDMNTYITEIKECNGLKDNKIYTGCYLIIPYYK